MYYYKNTRNENITYQSSMNKLDNPNCVEITEEEYQAILRENNITFESN